jgi:hypothetical protein
MQKLVLPLGLASLALAGVALYAQGADHGGQEIGVAQVKALTNHHPRWANAVNDAGSLPPDKVLDQMTVILARSPEQQLAFESFLADQQNPASPEIPPLADSFRSRRPLRALPAADCRRDLLAPVARPAHQLDFAKPDIHRLRRHRR